MRPVVAVVAAAIVAAAGAVILGEYELSRETALVAGPLFGVAVAETIASVARRDVDDYLAGAAALLTEAGLVWSAYISTGHRLDLARPEAWAAVALGAVAAAAWLRSGARRGRSTSAPT
ncbi:MAG TPA: hypothetical protein VF230_05960 [Acidimicrobiales bacterium]